MKLDKIKKNNNGTILKWGLLVNDNLPIIEDISEVNPRNAQEVAKRLCAISYVIGSAFGADRNDLVKYLKDYKLWPYVSDKEKALLLSNTLSKQDKINVEWLSECSQALAWSLGMVELDPFKHCDDDLVDKIPLLDDPSEFISVAYLRPIDDIQYQSDLLYRLHWYARKCNLENIKCEISLSTIAERRKAIDWIYGTDKNWDHISLDT